MFVADDIQELIICVKMAQVHWNSPRKNVCNAGEGRENGCCVPVEIEKEPYWDDKYSIGTGLVATIREKDCVNCVLPAHAKCCIGISLQEFNDNFVLSISVG